MPITLRTCATRVIATQRLLLVSDDAAVTAHRQMEVSLYHEKQVRTSAVSLWVDRPLCRARAALCRATASQHGSRTSSMPAPDNMISLLHRA